MPRLDLDLTGFEFNFAVKYGDTPELLWFDFRDENNELLELPGLNWEGQLRKFPRDTEVLGTITIEVDTETQGLWAQFPSGLPPGDWPYDLKCTDGPTTYVKGVMTVEWNVTR